MLGTRSDIECVREYTERQSLSFRSRFEMLCLESLLSWLNCT
jgi:hypothetical protein